MHFPAVARRPVLAGGEGGSRSSLLVAALLLLVTGCGAADAFADEAGSAAATQRTASSAAEPLVVGAIPDQDPHELQRLHGLLADHLERELGVPVEYVPVTDYAAAVNLFRAGDLDLVWFGGLTGVQARLQTPGAEVVAQRDIDEDFRSVFIVNTETGLQPVDDVAALGRLRGRRFTFGSASSTSGRLMPQYFLQQAGVASHDFAGAPGFSGSHDKTIDLVESGSFEAGVLNEQVWDARVDAGAVDTDRVQVFFRTPAYHDYHWVLGPSAVHRYGEDFPERVRDALLGLSRDEEREAPVLDLFGAERFVPVEASDHAQIEEVARGLGLVR